MKWIQLLQDKNLISTLYHRSISLAIRNKYICILSDFLILFR
jgi:hypothetical protein